MTTTSYAQRQPTKLDYASPTQFKFNIIKLPKVEYFCTAVNVPGISLGTTSYNTPLKNIPMPGEKLTYDDLEMTFLVDENLDNYAEIHGWLMGIGFPRDRQQARDLLGAGADRFPKSSGTDLTTDAGKVKYGPIPIGGMFSDATLTILSSKNRPVKEVRFSDVIPTALSGLSYSQQADDIDYLQATVSFDYKIYEFASVGASSTTTVTS